MSTVPNPPSPIPGRAAEAPALPVTRASLLLVISTAVQGGAPAPIRIEAIQEPSGQLLEVVLPAGDTSGVLLYASLFGLPQPYESGWSTRRGRGRVRVFGSSSTTLVPGEEVTRPQLFGGWHVAVQCDIEAPPEAWDCAVGVAQVAPALHGIVA